LNGLREAVWGAVMDSVQHLEQAEWVF
jgi:hypothetical protein